MDSAWILSTGDTEQGGAGRVCVQAGVFHLHGADGGRRTGPRVAEGETSPWVSGKSGRHRPCAPGDHLPRTETGRDGSGRTRGGKSGALFCLVAFKTWRGIQTERPIRRLYRWVCTETAASREVSTET